VGGGGESPLWSLCVNNEFGQCSMDMIKYVLFHGVRQGVCCFTGLHGFTDSCTWLL